jgi:hypothetical protein
LATTHRNKKRLAAQQVLLQLEVLAHNVLIWARAWLAPHSPKLARLGLKRWVRDIFRMDGFLIFDQALNLIEVHLNRADPFARDLSMGLAVLFNREQVAICLGEI